MIDHALNDGLEAITDSESVWLSFLASPAAPNSALMKSASGGLV
jgi:hypothetical protein